MKRANYFTPVVGQTYTGRNGYQFLCRAVKADGVAVMERTSDRWTLDAHGVQQYDDGTIEWDYSTSGHWNCSHSSQLSNIKNANFILTVLQKFHQKMKASHQEWIIVQKSQLKSNPNIIQTIQDIKDTTELACFVDIWWEQNRPDISPDDMIATLASMYHQFQAEQRVV